LVCRWEGCPRSPPAGRLAIVATAPPESKWLGPAPGTPPRRSRAPVLVVSLRWPFPTAETTDEVVERITFISLIERRDTTFVEHN